MTGRAREICINDLMVSSGVKFGTSGARGRVDEMTDEVCYAYTLAFLQHLEKSRGLTKGGDVAIAGDLRPSTPRILSAAALAIRDAGYRPLNCGFIPSPAVACFGFQKRIPSLMVTGSHIPDDRNGIKFNTATGEILKEDEESIRAQVVTLPGGRFDARGCVSEIQELPVETTEPARLFVRRYLDFFPAGCLGGKRIGVYEHSSVAREFLVEVLSGLGAEVVRLDRSDTFVPVDTEAIRPEDAALARRWAAESKLDAVVSADGDGDRPLVSDERGLWLRGDVAGVLCARHLGVRGVVTPVSSNSVAEKSGYFDQVIRTRIGSPFVIEGMAQALAGGAAPVAGYEANGGFLLASDIVREGRRLAALPTRDALIVILGVLLLAAERRVPVSALLDELPKRFTASERVKEFPTEVSAARIAALAGDSTDEAMRNVEAQFGGLCGRVAEIDRTDGLRITFENDEVIHLRPSGNAPEFRCYNEAGSDSRARELNAACMAILEGWKQRTDEA